jgi:hypothetical protein
MHRNAPLFVIFIALAVILYIIFLDKIETHPSVDLPKNVDVMIVFSKPDLKSRVYRVLLYDSHSMQITCGLRNTEGQISVDLFETISEEVEVPLASEEYEKIISLSNTILESSGWHSIVDWQNENIIWDLTVIAKETSNKIKSFGWTEYELIELIREVSPIPLG